MVGDAPSGDAAVVAGEAAAAAASGQIKAAQLKAAQITAESGAGPAEAPLVDLTAAAFFDVDNTMMVGASIFHFARGLAARKFFTTSDLLGFAWQQIKFRVGGRETDVSGHRDTALSFVAGRPVDEFVALGEDIYDELMADRIWAGTRALAQMHLDAGQRVWLVTATPVELAQIIARRLGLTGALGTIAEMENGVYTGQAGRRDPARAREGARRARARRVARGSTCAAAPRTRTRSTTCRCSRPSARPLPSTPIPSCATSPSPGAGRSATSAPAARPPRSACRPCWARARWRAP